MTDKEKNFTHGSQHEKTNNKVGGNKNNTDFTSEVDVDTDKKNSKK